jgi:sulfite exporter TauE/SafE
VQGGLLATSVARQIERDVEQRNAPTSAIRPKTKTRRVAATAPAPATPTPRAQGLSLPIILFLVAKLVAYTSLGFLLGLLGSVIQLTPPARAALQLAIGVFMVGNALRMLNVHPIFRYFSIEPPRFITRFIRQRARQGADLVTPAFLGLLTVFIPCGVTQTMMALALGTGNAMQGATIMFAFTLGASPVFFTLAYLATRLGATLEKRFALAAAIVLLALGVYSIDSALRLAGAPVTLLPPYGSPVAATAPGAAAATDGESQTLTVNAKANGYEPALLRARAGAPLRLALVTNRTYSCARAFVIPSLRIEKLLPETGTVWFDIPPQPAGSTLKFTCSMGMYGGQIQFVN